MANVYKQTLKDRKEQERIREDQIRHALQGRAKTLEKQKREKKQKRKTVGELLAYVNFCGIQQRELKPAYTYIPRSCNLDRQLTGLIRHVFVQYPTPAFLYQACTKGEDPFDFMHETYRQWFVTIAQGGSFAKLVKGTMTAREAFVFLTAPPDGRIHENVWWARMKVAGMPDSVIEKLIERMFSQFFFDDPGGRLAEVIQFFARYHAEMNRVTFGEVTDFLAWKLQNDGEFRMKGRTVGSVVKLTNEWHALMQKARLGHNVEWAGFGFPDWEFIAKNCIWSISELRSNRELMNEGRKQKHCVYSYVDWCSSGRASIFSLRCYRKIAAGCTPEGRVIWDRSMEMTRVTIEVNSRREVIQVRGSLNRAATDEERKVIHQWVADKGLTLR